MDRGRIFPMDSGALRILHVIPQFPWFGSRTVVGGHASALFSLALAQAAAGEDVTILSYAPGGAGARRLAERLTLHSLFAAARPGRIEYGLRFLRAAQRWVVDRPQPFDVVHGHSGFADYLLVTDRLRRLSGRAALHTLYCPLPERGGRWNLPGVRGLLQRCAARLDALVAISENVARSLRRWGAREPLRISVAVDIERFRPASDVNGMRRSLNIAEDDVAVLFVGNAKPQKNLGGVLQAVHALRPRHCNLRLVVTTELRQSSSDRALAALRRQAAELDLESCIVQKGIVEDMPRLMQACDVLVAPFLDTLGPSDYFMAALEAMACGKPAVVSAVGGMPEVVSDKVGRLVDPRRPEEIAAALEPFIEDGELRRTAGARARTYIEGHFDPTHVARDYRTLYESILR